jgi:histidine ammonia-lyase
MNSVSYTPLTLAPGSVTLHELRNVYTSTAPIALAHAAHAAIHAAQQAITRMVASGRVVYGVNTGFGKLAQTVIPRDRLAELQRNLVLSHSVGTGALLPDAMVRLIMVLKVISLARGHSGVRLEVVDALLRLINAQVYPCIPSKGSVGASGDLAPLAHLAAALIGVGEVRINGTIMPAAQGLAQAGLAPLTLGPKEGLALLNGTQASTALALGGLFRIEQIFSSAVLAGSLSLEAIKGSAAPFDARIHAARGQHGQIAVAQAYRRLLEGSAIQVSHRDCGRVQDPYSIRCQPQVMGACLDQIRHAAATLEIEANAASDNPLVFPEDDTVISGGNFHAEPVAFAADMLAIALSEIGSLSERRIALLLDTHLSGLPPFLIHEGGINSGFMIAQVTAAALTAENKCLAHPASTDSLPTSANQEDHVSMATYAARRLGDMADNAAGIIGIEAMAAAQGMEFHRPLRSTAVLEQVHASIRARVAFYEQDRFFAPDVKQMEAWVVEHEAPAYLHAILPSAAPRNADVAPHA